MSGAKFTPGPWRWELNTTSKVIQLCGGRPQFDKTVMDFTRWGMGRAAPRFQGPTEPHRLMTRAEHFGVVVAGREHHRSWFQGIDQPDANLIAAAPELYEALEAAEKQLVHDWHKIDNEWGPSGETPDCDETIARVRAALAKARGGA